MGTILLGCLAEVREEMQVRWLCALVHGMIKRLQIEWHIHIDNSRGELTESIEATIRVDISSIEAIHSTNTYNVRSILDTLFARYS